MSYTFDIIHSLMLLHAANFADSCLIGVAIYLEQPEKSFISHTGPREAIFVELCWVSPVPCIVAASFPFQTCSVPNFFATPCTIAARTWNINQVLGTSN